MDFVLHSDFHLNGGYYSELAKVRDQKGSFRECIPTSLSSSQEF